MRLPQPLYPPPTTLEATSTGQTAYVCLYTSTIPMLRWVLSWTIASGQWHKECKQLYHPFGLVPFFVGDFKYDDGFYANGYPIWSKFKSLTFTESLMNLISFPLFGVD